MQVAVSVKADIAPIPLITSKRFDIVELREALRVAARNSQITKQHFESEGASGMKLTHSVKQIPVATRQSSRGSVIAARDSSVEVGLEMFDLGGNAVDAAVATALVAGVIEPTETTLAGCGFILLHHPEHGPIEVDFGPLAPMAVSEDLFEIDTEAASSNVLGLAPVRNNANVTGPLASGVPRTLYALLETHARWGRLSRRQVLAPAIRAAEEGFGADGWFVLNALQDVDLLAKDPGCAQTFLDEKGLPIGSKSASAYGRSVDSPPLVKQPLLARTLRTLADRGREDLIAGNLAEELVQTFAEYGMVLTRDDLARMVPRIGAPRTLKFRGSTVAVPRAPGGGLTVLQALNVWQHLVPHDRKLDRGTRVKLMSRVLRNAFADRYHWLGDCEKRAIPVDALLSDEYAQWLASTCANTPWNNDLVQGPPWTYFADRALNDPWPFDPEQRAAPGWSSDGATEPTSGTTHVSASDTDGWVIAITHTAANHFGSAVLCPRTGLLFDSSMAWFNAKPGAANSIAAGARPVANMGPALVIDEQGETVRAVGASGGRRIISAVMQLVIELAENGRSIEEALAQPRIDASGAHVVLHEFDAEIADSEPELVAVLVPQHSLAYELDFARANVAEYCREGVASTAIEARAYDY